MPRNLENPAVVTRLEKVNLHPNSEEEQLLRNFQTTGQLHSSPMLIRLCSKSSKLGYNSTWNKNFQMFKLDLEKAEEPEIKLPIFAGS